MEYVFLNSGGRYDSHGDLSSLPPSTDCNCSDRFVNLDAFGGPEYRRSSTSLLVRAERVLRDCS